MKRHRDIWDVIKVRLKLTKKVELKNIAMELKNKKWLNEYVASQNLKWK